MRQPALLICCVEGIDAPELHQTCTAYGQQWACGRTLAEWLQEHLNGRQVECVGHTRDRYGRSTRGLDEVQNVPGFDKGMIDDLKSGAQIGS